MGNEDLGRCPERTPSLVIKHGEEGWPDPYAASRTLGSILNILSFSPPVTTPREMTVLATSTLSRAGKWSRSNYPPCAFLPRCYSFMRLCSNKLTPPFCPTSISSAFILTWIPLLSLCLLWEKISFTFTILIGFKSSREDKKPLILLTTWENPVLTKKL